MGRIESESVSGDVTLKFAAMPAAEFDVQTFSGDIKNCFGPKPMESRYGPGSRLQFMNGEGHAHVRINTKSGDVRLCVKGMTDANTHVGARVGAGAAAGPRRRLACTGRARGAPLRVLTVRVCLRRRVMSADCGADGSPVSWHIPATVTAFRSAQ